VQGLTSTPQKSLPRFRPRLPASSLSTMSGASAAAASNGIAATIERLATLQNLIKRDPEAYREEFGLQHQHFLAELDILKLNPAGQADTFTALTNFLAHVSSCYPKELLPSFPTQLMSLLAEHADLLHPEVRRSLAQALILMRNKGVIEAVPVHKLFFSLLRVRDRTLRSLLHSFIVHDIRNNNNEKKDDNMNRAIQGMLYGLITEGAGINGPKGSSSASSSSSSGKAGASATTAAAGTGGLTAAHRSLMVLIELYKRHVWRDAKTVNAIANGLLSPHTKLLVTSLNFFLGIGSDGATEVGDDDDDEDEEQDSDGELPEGHVDAKTMRKAMQKHAHSKHTAKRMRQTERMIAGLKKNARKAAANAGPAFPAIQLLHDPQGIAERLFARLRTTGEK
jgi:protein SDA1